MWIHTSRLKLRPWVDSDLEPFAALNADPRVMEFLPGILTTEESDAMAARIREHFDEHGYGFWAVEVVNGPAFIGFVGLSHPRFEAHFTPCVEIGWRLAAAAWGKGYATEAASAALIAGFDKLGLNEIVSITIPANRRSWQVMKKLHMTRDPADDFVHPSLPAGHPFQPHILYRQTAAQFRALRNGAEHMP